MGQFGYGLAAVMALTVVDLASCVSVVEAATVERGAAPDYPLLSGAFVEAADGALKHRFTGLVCPATLAGVKRTEVVIGQAERATCIYGLSTDNLQFSIVLSPQKPNDTPQGIAEDYDAGPGIPAASWLIPIGQSDGPQAGRSVARAKAGTSILVSVKEGWALTFAASWTQARFSEAKAVATDLFKAFQAARP